MICSSVCLLRFIVWSFLKARLQFTSDQFNGATSHATQTWPRLAEPRTKVAVPICFGRASMSSERVGCTTRSTKVLSLMSGFVSQLLGFALTDFRRRTQQPGLMSFFPNLAYRFWAGRERSF
jgi:hypothetical protein